jgi:multiple sugar transport system substrate-binding protein
MRLARLLPALAAAALAVPLLAACSSSSGGSGSGTVTWWTWDDHQAAAYQQCVPGFEKANPGITVKISQYNVADYFTKLTADFVAGTAPDAFQNSVQYFPTYVDQHELQPLDSYTSASDLKRFAVGVDVWQGKDGKQYGLPMDWATAGIYYSESAVTKAGYTDQDLATMTWNPTDGGTFEKIAAHLTVDANGRRGDQPGFDPKHVKVYGTGVLGADDFIGQTSWFPFAASTGWTLGNTKAWPTSFNYTDRRFVSTMDWVRSMVAKGYSPAYNQFTVSDSQQVGSGKVAMTVGGSWEATSFAALPGVKVGVAGTPVGPVGRRAISNAYGNVMWAGSKHQQATWKWMNYQESAACQTKAATSNGSFFPSVGASMQALVAQEKTQGVDLAPFLSMESEGDLEVQAPYRNGSDMQAKLTPLFQSYFGGGGSDSVWATAEKTSHQVLTAKQ